MKKRVFMTGGTGSMGIEGVRLIAASPDLFDLTVLVLPGDPLEKRLKGLVRSGRVHVVYGDMSDYGVIHRCVRDMDIILHVGALVSPKADYDPGLSMRINYGSVVNILRAVYAHGLENHVKLVYIGTVAETGDRMPPIHWGRVGDPIKPSVHDYYAVAKVAAERAVIESGLRYWVSIRQTGIMCAQMTKVNDGIIFHNCLDNVLEYISETDSGRLLRNVCDDLPEEFWCHIYNAAGGAAARASFYQVLSELFSRMGIKDFGRAFEANWFAIRNFHGQYYLDGDVLDGYLRYRKNSSIEHFYEVFLKAFGPLVPLSRAVCRLPMGERLICAVIHAKYKRIALSAHGILGFLKEGKSDKFEPFLISREEWSKIPSMEAFEHFSGWNRVIPIDHGYDESKPEGELTLEDVGNAAVFRGGKLLSESMEKGDWTGKLDWICAFGHRFSASPRLVLQGGHWCPECERSSWNYHEIAKRSPFFAQVWFPLHSASEPSKVYPKQVSDLDNDILSLTAE